MANLRATFRLIRFLVSTLFYYSVILLGRPFSIFGLDKKAWTATLRQIWGKSVVRILNMKLTVKGTPPEPPFFLVSNHLSYVDVWVLFTTAKGTFITKSDVRTWPVIGFILYSCGMIFIDRDRKTDVTRVNEEISTHLTPGQGVILFPEGTTSSGKQLLPFKSALFQYPAQTNSSVFAASISYATPKEPTVAHKKICWWDDTPFLEHFWNLLKIKEFTATVTYSREHLKNTNRKVLAKKSYALIEDSFEPVIHPPDYA